MTTFPADATLNKWDPALHVPAIGLINPKSGGQKGGPILDVCQRTEYYKDRFFNIIKVIQGSEKGGLLDTFRQRLNEAKVASAEDKSGASVRPRLICGGGDGTASFALLIVFKALLADNERSSEGLADTGNGFSWTDDEMAQFFPALVQMPLGTGNDLGNVMGWGHKYPGFSKVPCSGASTRAHNLAWWFDRALFKSTPVVNFDVWGFMPPPGKIEMDVKMCELAQVMHANGLKHMVMKPPDVVVPFLVILYVSFGFSAEVVARFQLNRHPSQLQNVIEYIKIGPAIFCGSKPVELKKNMSGIRVTLPNEGDDGEKLYFPPRPTRKDTSYGEVGFLNINSYTGRNVSAKDRARCCFRWCICRGRATRRKPPSYNDGLFDLFRQRQPATFAKTGLVLQTDKVPAATFHYEKADAQGAFLQYDGEGRFAFHPTGEPWRMDVQRVLNIPMVAAPGCEKHNDEPVAFKFVGDADHMARVKARIVKWVNGELINELNATAAEIKSAGLPLTGAFSGVHTE